MRGVAAAAGAAYATIGAAASSRIRIREIGVFLSAATLTPLGLGRPANTPVQTSTVVGQSLDPADAIASLGSIAASWSTAPTVPAALLRRAQIPAVAGAGVIWTWSADRPLVVPASAFVVLWNFGASAGAAPDVYWAWEE